MQQGGLQWCKLSSLPISGYFCIISAPTVNPAWLWKSQTASVIATCYARASTKAKKIQIRPDFGRSYRHLSFSKQPMKTGHSTLLCYIIPSLPHPVSAVYFRNRYRGKMLFWYSSMIYISQDSHTNLPPKLSYTNTSKLTWIKPLLKTIQSFFHFYLIPLFEDKKKKGKTPVYLAHEIIYCRLIHTYLPRYPSPFIINLCSYYQSNAYF